VDDQMPNTPPSLHRHQYYDVKTRERIKLTWTRSPATGLGYQWNVASPSGRWRSGPSFMLEQESLESLLFYPKRVELRI